MSTAVPVRYPQGMTNAFPGEILSKYGNPNPFNLHRLEDDFDWLGATGVKYTLTSSGSIATAAGDGGRILLTTGAVSGNLTSIQSVVAGFTPSLGKRMWYAARFQMADVSVPLLHAGLIQTTATPGTVTDGIVFEKATASTVITLKHYVGSAATLSLSLSGFFTPVAGADFDLGFYVDEKGYLFGYANTVANGGLFGFCPDGAAYPVYRGAAIGGAIPTLTTANLNPTLGITTQAASATTLNADFMMAAKERA